MKTSYGNNLSETYLSEPKPQFFAFLYGCAILCTPEMIEKIEQLTEEEKNLLIFVIVQKLAKITKLDLDIVLSCLLNDLDSFMSITEMLTYYT